MYECAVRAMRKQLKLNSDSVGCGSKRCKQGYGDACGGSGGVCIWRSLESGGRFCVCAFGRSLALVTLNIFSHLLYFIKTFTHFVLSMQFANIMLQINCNSTQRRLIPVNFDGSYYASLNYNQSCFLGTVLGLSLTRATSSILT
jgi:hypothetical protein